MAEWEVRGGKIKGISSNSTRSSVTSWLLKLANERCSHRDQEERRSWFIGYKNIIDEISSTYHPKSEGQTKVENGSHRTFLWCFIVDQPHSWAQRLHWAKYLYNTNSIESFRVIPLKVVCGQSTWVINHFLPCEVKIEVGHWDLTDRDEDARQLKYHLYHTQEWEFQLITTDGNNNLK